SQGESAFGVLYQQKPKILDTAQHGETSGKNLVWLRQPRFFIYS
ncbi:unnamed protein product, partial [marine sediment metagenome]